MGRTILTYAECIVRPDELDGQLHEGSHTYGRLHVVREYEESTAGRDDTTMQCHTDTAASHGQLCHTSLEEGTAEVALGESLGLLQEAIRLVRVGEVGGSTNHIGNLLCQYAQASGRSVAGSIVVLLNTLAPVNLGSLSAEPLSLLGSLVGIGLSPCLLLGITLSADSLEFLSTLGVEFLYLGEDLEWILGVTTQVLHGVDIGITAQGSTVCLAVGLVRSAVSLEGTLTHDALTDDEGRLAFYLLCSLDGRTDLGCIVTIDFDDLPALCAVLGSSVLSHYLLGLGRELDVVAVIEHDEVVQAQHAGDTGSTL